MAEKPRYYVTTAIAYPNGVPHIGHAYEAIATDAIARFQRLDGYDVYFLTGTDEHGIKMLQTAAKEGLTPKALTERTVPRFQAMVERMNCSNDDFIRTTEERHFRSSEAIWQRMEANGDIYLDKYSGWYSVRDEAYYDEDETRLNEQGVRVGPQGTPVEWVEEESYFFRLSAYQQKLIDLYEKQPDFVLPKERLNEVSSFVRGGLQDLSISRTTFDWGIPVPPKDPQGQPRPTSAKHVMYVWVDALTNYITGVGFPDTNSPMYRRYWPADLHVIGKDIVRFHAVYWPAFLMSAGIELPRRVFSHGFLFNRGEKMSKSVGNVIDPFALADAYGVDQLRYFLLREVPFGQDGTYSHEAIVNRINADLANDLGNLAQRSLSMVARQLGGVLPKPGDFSEADKTILAAADAMIGKAREAMKTQQLHQVLNAAWAVVADANRYFAGEAPWALAKTDPPRQGTVLYVTAEAIRQVAILAQPFIPVSAGKLLDLLAVPADARAFTSLGSAHRLAGGTTLPAPSAVFPRYIDPDKPEKAEKPPKPPAEVASMNKIVSAILQEYSKENGIEALDESIRFEHLTSYLTIRRHFSRALDLADVIVGSGGDTGVDSIAIIVNGALMTDVDQVQEMLDQNGYIEATFVFVQAERSEGFDGAKIGNIATGVRDFFRDKPTLVQNENVQDAFEIKTAIYDRASKFRERPSCHVYYVTTGKWEAPSDLVARISGAREALLATGIFKEVTFIPYGADDIHRLHTNAKNAITRTFTFREHLEIPSIKGVNLSFLGYLPAKDYVKIIGDDAGDGIVGGIFYDNVRDWQDYNEVNAKIRDTLLSPTKERFVLMNNGVTIIARGLKQSGKSFTIEDFQVVNGCQTSNVIFDQRANLDDSVHIPLRLIWTNDDNVIDSVVTGTNQQTELTPEQIYARTEFAKRLEKHFESYPEKARLHYERRDGQYDRVPVEKGRIVSPQTLIKVFAAVFLEEPHVAAKSYKQLRARVGKDIFMETDKLDPYFLAALAAYRLEVQLRAKPMRAYKSARYHMLLTMRLLMDPMPISHMNSRDMEKRCAAMIATLSDEGEANKLIQQAKAIIDKVSGGDLSRDNVRTVTITEAITKMLKKFKA